MSDPQRRTPADAVSPRTDGGIEIVTRFLSRRDARDVSGCVELVAEDAVWHSPVGAPRRGRQGFAEAIEAAYAGTEWFVTETLGVQQDGGVIIGRVRNRGARAGRELDSVQQLAFRLRDGQIAEVRINVDDQAAVEAFWDASS